MKQVKTLITAMVVIFLMAGINTVQAQATPSKVCHVASQELVELLPQAKAADKQLRDSTCLSRTFSWTKEIRRILPELTGSNGAKKNRPFKAFI